MAWWKEKPDYNQIFSALTLTTPELTNERNQIEQEEQRKEHLHKKLLTNLLPWETNEEESKILEEECKDAILSLSKKDETFVSSITPEEQDTLPPLLLVDFDLDLHYSLIKRMLNVDSNLVEMQAQLSGAGAQETKFWKNYFQRCALVRKQVGMNMYEIWRDDANQVTSTDSVSTARSGEHSRSSSQSSVVTATADNTTSTNAKQRTEQPSDERQNSAFFSERFGISANVTTNLATSASNLVGGLFSANNLIPTEATDGQVQNDNREANDFVDSFEIIKDKEEISYDDDDKEDEEDLDDLEAEIAKELES